jgi:hypothetical protein
VEFESTWRSLRGDLQAQAAFLLLLPPPSLPSVFKTSLTAQVLVAMLHAALAGLAAQGTDVAEVQQYLALLAGLPAVPRFDMAAMSISSRDKAAVRQAWDGAAGKLAGEQAEQLQQLRSKFRL